MFTRTGVDDKQHTHDPHGELLLKKNFKPQSELAVWKIHVVKNKISDGGAHDLSSNHSAFNPLLT